MEKLDRKEYKRMQKKRRRKRHRVRNAFLKAFFSIVLLGVIVVIIRLIGVPRVKNELTIEAGSGMPELSQFLLREYEDSHFSQKYEETLDLNTVADYEIGITIAEKEYTSTLHVVDTIAPKVTGKDVQAFIDNALQPEDFIESIDDVTQTTASFVSQPDFTVAGIQNVELTVVDEGGNSTRITVKMTVLQDAEPPVIEGVEELTVAIGDSLSYKKNVTVTDNYDENVSLTVDSSQVDLNTIGDYPVTYIAQDAAGNTSQAETVVHVKEPSVETATEETVNRKADELLDQITTDNMSQYEVAEAIFKWTHENVRWSDNTPKTNWVQGAYRGLFEQKGDCYVYAATAKCLLTQAGIENMDIGFSNENRTHYWNLIDLGDGWYHFDATRRADGKSFFYSTDEEIRQYSKTHKGSHAYDPDEYPEIQ